MSSGNDGFELVLYKGKRKLKAKRSEEISVCKSHLIHADMSNKEAVLRRVHEAKAEIKSSDLLASALASLREGIEALSQPIIKEIVCFGLGNIGDCLTSKYQFGFLLCLKEIFKVEVRLYDPRFTELDNWLLEQFQCGVFKENFKAKFRIQDNATRIFFLPHCPVPLTNNLLWANWGKNLNRCIIIGNSISSIVELSKLKDCEYITNIAPHVVELALINSFKYYDIFNNTGIHIFPWDKLKFLSEEFWSPCPEPLYVDDVSKKLNQIWLGP